MLRFSFPKAAVAAVVFAPWLLLAQPAPPTGLWHATLEPVTGLEIAFDIRVAAKGKTLSGAIVNGSTESRFTSVSWDGESLVLDMAHYDGRLVAWRDGENLGGTFTRATATGKFEVPFRAVRTAPTVSTPPKDAPVLTGEWGVEMGEGEKASRLLGAFRQDGGKATGTLLSTTGDFGPMHGTWDGTNLVLTIFDGIFIYRLDGTLGEGGSLSGTFRSRSGVPTPWKGQRLDAAGAAKWLPAGGSIVRAKDPQARVAFAFPSAPGKPVSLDDPDLKNKPVVVSISGTWCPNCHDEAPVLEEIYRRYRGKGLAVVSLSYEYTEDEERSFRQIGRFRERHGVTYPILFAGPSKGASASSPLSLLEGWKGFPTTLYLDRNHRIVKAYSGFDGPSTGARFAVQKKEIEESVKGLLAR